MRWNDRFVGRPNLISFSSKALRQDLEQSIETPLEIKIPSNTQHVERFPDLWQKMQPEQQHRNCGMAFSRQGNHTTSPKSSSVWEKIWFWGIICIEIFSIGCSLFLVACTRLYNPLCRWVGRSVSYTLHFLIILFLWPHCPSPNGLVTSNMATAHPHAT